MYKLYQYNGKNIGAILEKEEGKFIMFTFADPDNTDYQAYLKWLADGNTPLPAENS